MRSKKSRITAAEGAVAERKRRSFLLPVRPPRRCCLHA